MSQERNGESGHHRLFHAMVLMGGSIALGCGGVSESTSGDDTDGTGGTGSLSGAGSAGAGSGGTGGTSSSSGGAPPGGTGGVIVLPPAAGTTSVDPNPPDCPPAQWTCANVVPVCYEYTYSLPTGCECDAARPATAGDCPAGSVFACHAGAPTTNEGARPIVPFSCSCVPDSGNCDAECSDAAPTSGMCTDVHTPNGRSVLCNCAVVVLR